MDTPRDGWVVHADEALVAIDKPAGMLSVPGRGASKRDCAWLRVQSLWPQAEVVHRLDMATSGLLLFALGAEVQRLMHTAFAERRVDKRYVACVRGLVAANCGEIDLPLAADWPQRPRQKVDAASGKASLTRWRVLARDAVAGTTRLELQPLSGRTHQLRVHLQAIGHPIVGDSLYGSDERADGASRLLLHACGLRFLHPVSGEPMALEAATPF